MNLSEALAILQEVGKILAALSELGLKINGTIDLADLVALFKKA